MKKSLKILLPSVIILLLSGCVGKNGFKSSDEITSPDGKVKVAFHLDKEGNMLYSLHYRNAPVIEPSAMGLELQQGGILGKNMKLIATAKSDKDETYQVHVGKSSAARDHHHMMRLILREHNGSRRQLVLEFRAYNDGAAFRYIVPDQESIASYNLTDEKTSFRISPAAEFWLLNNGSFTSNYEKQYTKAGLDGITDTSYIGLPLSFQIPGVVEGAVTEADLEDYPGMYINRDSGSDALDVRFPPHPDNREVIMISDRGFHTPWRVIMTADKLIDLIPSNMIINLNEPCKIDDTSWIRSGLAAWDWWSGKTVKNAKFQTGMNDRTMMHYIDFAAEFGLEYMLIDAGWYGESFAKEADVTVSIPEINIPQLVGYAGKKNVNILLWLNWRHMLPQMEKAFALYQQWGVKGVKIDFMNRDDQVMVNLYKQMIETAAKYELLVDLHGAYKPTGIRRTWPNLMTREGVLGLEHLKWSANATPGHNVTIPFTRMLAGPMDYTPGGFGQVIEKEFIPRNQEPMVPGTRCHQLAMYVVFESPLQMVSDHPEAYRGQPGSDFLKVVPAAWDETLGLEGEIGEYILLARRSGNKWFLGAMAGTVAKELAIPLTFLQNDRKYKAVIYTDAEDSYVNPKKLKITEIEVSSQSAPLNISMVKGGGMAAVITPL